MHDCEKSFWTYDKGYEWEQANSVQERTRKELCSQLQLKHVRVPEEYDDGALYGLGEHEHLGCVSKLAEGGEKCWFSTFFSCYCCKKLVKTVSVVVSLAILKVSQNWISNKKNGQDLKRIRRTVGSRTKEPDFDEFSKTVLKYSSNPWEIEAVKISKQLIGEPWVMFFSLYCFFAKFVPLKGFGVS